MMGNGTPGLVGILTLALIGGALSFACSSPDSSSKTPLVVCTAGEKGCPDEKRGNTPKQGTSTGTSGGPSGAPSAPSDDVKDDTKDETKDETKATPEGSDGGAEPVEAGPPPLGAVCTELNTCCQQLKDQGYDPATCEGIVETRNENACSLQKKQYTDYGDCTL